MSFLSRVGPTASASRPAGTSHRPPAAGLQGCWAGGVKIHWLISTEPRWRRIASRLKRRTAKLAGFDDKQIGIAAHKPGESALETMQAADRSLYAAKNEGRNAVVIELKRYRAA